MPVGDVGYILLAVNPIGGIIAAIPFAILTLHYAAWLTFITAVPCSYVQVLVVDFGWTLLNKWPWFHKMLSRPRAPWITKLLASGGGFWQTVVLSPFVGPWLVMALMRFAGIPQSKVALPILIGMSTMAAVLIGVCVYAPHLIGK